LRPWQKPDHFFPPSRHQNELTNLIAKPVFIPERIAAVFNHYLRKLSMEIVAPNPESIGQNVNAVEDEDLFEIHHAIREDFFDGPWSQCEIVGHRADRWVGLIDPGHRKWILGFFYLSRQNQSETVHYPRPN
jgi:hypothetical protein